MSDPDVEHAGWATEGPGSRLKRRRNPLLGLVTLVLLLGGVATAVAGIVQLTAHAGPSEEETEARGVVAGLDGPDAPPARFTAPSERSYTVWLDLDDVRQINRDQVVAATACEASGADGSVATFRGSRQGSSVTIESTSTVGTFSVPRGATVVGCRQFPFGRRGRRGRLREERPFLVARGKPSAGTGGLVLLFGGLAAALLALPLGIRWYAGRLIERA